MASLLLKSQFTAVRCCSYRNCLKFSQKANHHKSYAKWNRRGAKILTFGLGGGFLAGVFLSRTTSKNDVTAGLTNVKSEMETKDSLTAVDYEKYTDSKITLEQAVERSRDLLKRIKDECGSPGVVIGVSVNGQMIWSEGIGFADVENRVPMSPDAVLRIASISKPVTMAIVGRLWEEGKLDIDAPVQKYVPYFPEKIVDGEKVTITTRHLVSHLSGIRHYDKTPKVSHSNKGKEIPSKDKNAENKKQDEKLVQGSGDVKHMEFYLAKKFSSVEESVGLFKDDPLLHKPGTKYLYTTHGWTLVSAVLEGASGSKFPNLLDALFLNLGMENTLLDRNGPLIYHRARNYVKNEEGRLVNAPYVDLSYKWAGGGLLSTVGDLLKFGNVMLYSYQNKDEISQSLGESRNGKTSNENNSNKSAKNTKINDINEKVLPGFLKQQTVQDIWSVVKNTGVPSDKGPGYGMGWAVVPEKHKFGCCAHGKYYVSHSGGAMGASSVLLIYPREASSSFQGNAEGGVKDHPEVQGQMEKDSNNSAKSLPSGICVAIVANLNSVGLSKSALKIAKLFDRIEN